ncbi:MAG: hypothetical protein HOP08_15520 [Cyclobacteriaceae bacterium]|nr:hypothetical protein [Cyclobacteriaceae bacterium]
MSFLQAIVRIKKSFFCKNYKAAKKKQQFIKDITTTQAFARMSTQDKITSLAKLIFLFQCDHGYSPIELEQKLIRLNSDLKSKVIKDWSGIYSEKCM